MLPLDALARELLNRGSAQPEQPVHFGEVCDDLGLPHRKGGSLMAGFTKLLKSRFGRADKPFRSKWVRGKALYTVDTETARAWLSVSSQNQETAI